MLILWIIKFGGRYVGAIRSHGDRVHLEQHPKEDGMKYGPRDALCYN